MKFYDEKSGETVEISAPAVIATLFVGLVAGGILLLVAVAILLNYLLL